MGLCVQEGQKNGLTEAGRPNDREIANVALMEIEPVRCAGSGFETRDRRPPMIAERFASREVCRLAKPAKFALEIRDRRAIKLKFPEAAPRMPVPD